MKFHEYLESNYVSTNIEIQKEYSSYKQGKIQAIQSLINTQRSFAKWTSFPIILTQYILTMLGFLDKPLTAVEIVKKNKEEIKRKQDEATLKLVQDNESTTKNEVLEN